MPEQLGFIYVLQANEPEKHLIRFDKLAGPEEQDMQPQSIDGYSY